MPTNLRAQLHCHRQMNRIEPLPEPEGADYSVADYDMNPKYDAKVRHPASHTACVPWLHSSKHCSTHTSAFNRPTLHTVTDIGWLRNDAHSTALPGSCLPSSAAC